MFNFSHDVVICTSKRKDSLFETLDSVIKCNSSSELKIVVVLNGENSLLIKELDNSLRVQYPTIKILISNPGLTTARNFALAKCKSEIITFLDDDVTLKPDYFISLDHLIFEDQSVVGSAPRIRNLYIERPLGKIVWKYPRMLDFLEKIKVNPYGKVTKWGNNHWFPDIPSDSRTCSWLPGCCMSFNRMKIPNLRFNEGLQLGPTGGYALGEDVDFSVRSGQFGKLVFNSRTEIVHHQAPSVRDNQQTMELARGYWVGYLYQSKNLRISLFFVISYNMSKLLLRILRNFLKGQFERPALDFFKGFSNQLRYKKIGFPSVD